MGEPEDWHAAEARWVSKGVGEQDLAYMTDDHWPIPRDIATVGFPFASFSFSWQLENEIEKQVIDNIAKFWKSLPGEQAKYLFADIVIHTLCEQQVPVNGDQQLLDNAELTCDILGYIAEENIFLPETWASVYRFVHKSPYEVTALEHLGRMIHPSGFFNEDDRTEDALGEIADRTICLLEENPKEGLFLLLSKLSTSVQIPRKPLNSDYFINSQNARISTFAMALKFTQPLLDSDAIEGIMQRIPLKKEEDVSFIIQVIERNLMNSPVAVIILEKLLKVLPPALVSSVGRQVMVLLLDLLGRRVASLSKRRVWEELCLPKGLYSLLDNQE